MPMGRPDEKDLAASVVPEYAQPWDKEIERRVVRKIDLALLPLMWVGYGLVYYDKAILGGAAVFGMTADLKLRVVVDPTTTPPKVSTTRLSWATSLFYFGMLTGVGPLTYLFQRLHLGRTVGAVIVVWGAVAMATAGVTTYKGLFAQRFFLGFAESIVPTAFMVIISGYYTQAEQTWRQCLWYSATGGWTVIGAGINYGFAHITGGDLKKWQYLYLMAGALTVLYGFVFFFFPNSPAQAWWFTEEEKRVAIERLRMGQMGVRCQKIKWPQIKEALLDVKVWLIATMMGAAYSVNGAVSGFGPLIVSTFGWSAYDALLWQMPLGGVCFVGIILAGYLSLKVRNIRLIMIIACCLPVIAGCAMIWKSSWHQHAATPIAGYTIIGFFAPVTSLIVSMGMANVAGNTKKSFMAAAIFYMYNVGNIVGPQWVRSEQIGSHYPRLWQGVIGCYALVIAIAITLYVMLGAENRRRDRLCLDEKEAERVAFDDLTDKQNKHFRNWDVMLKLLRDDENIDTEFKTRGLSYAASSDIPLTFNMSALRLCASRLLSSRPSTFILPSRAYSSFIAASTPRSAQRSAVFQSTRRWASAEPQDGTTISNEAEQSVATEDNAPPVVAESANLTEATEESLPAAEINEEILPQASQSAKATPEPSFKTQNSEEKKATIYIGNLFFDITESELVKEFTQFGTVSRCKVIRDTRGLSKGFAYLEFATIDSAESAIKTMNMQLFEGRRMTVQFAARDISASPSDARRTGPINAPSSTLFIGNMSFEMTDRDLGNLFRGIRNVLDVRVAIDRRTGQPRGFAHADFVDVKSAMEAMKVLQDKETYGRKLRVDYSYSSSQAPRNRPDSRSHPTETRTDRPQS